MRTLTTFAVAAVLLTFQAFGQDAVPSFSAFPAKMESKRARSVDIRNSPGAPTFRTRLRQAYEGEINFAGRYIIASWGCGTGCLSAAIIDTKYGRVYFPKEFSAIAVTFADTGYEEILNFRPNSRLLVISGTIGTEPVEDEKIEEGAHYFEWRNNRLRLVRFVPAERR